MDNSNDLKAGERLIEGKETAATETVVSGETRTTGQRVMVAENHLNAAAQDLTSLDKLTLHEERAVVDITKESAGAVTIRKLIKERTETVPVTLISEVLEIVVNHSGTGKVLLDGRPLEVGRTYEVLLQDERAVIQKEVFPVADISLRKQAQTFTHTEEVTLRREELDVSGSTELVHDITVEREK